jgi:hypothetical protein
MFQTEVTECSKYFNFVSILGCYPVFENSLTFFLIGTVGRGVQLGPLSTAATNRPIVPAPVIMMMEKLVE